MSNLLPGVSDPNDLKPLSIPELEELCKEIRDYFVEVITGVGGHFAPSLGVVELTVALHYVFDTPHDKLVWDVGHQGYVHKILTGRREALRSIRQYKGISGFLKPSESNYDTFGAGHASTSISAALGIAQARDLAGDEYKVVAIIGDGALTGGLAYEAMNNAGGLGTDILVILNDNSMSISPNVGAISRYLTDITTDPLYNRIKDEIWSLTERMPFGKKRLRRFVRSVEEALKSLLVPGLFFEQLGFRYFGPIDGHELRELVPVLRRLRSLRGANILHVRTVKGKGVDYAERDSVKFHAVSPPPKPADDRLATPKPPSYNKVFANTLIDLAKSNDKIVAVTAAMAEGTGLVEFQKAFPGRFFDVGIAEAHAVTFSAGLAAQGFRPCAAIYSTFLQRAYDQVIHDVSIQHLPVVFTLDRAGLCGADGPTHHGAFDLSYLTLIPEMIVAAPRNGDELRNLMYTAFAQGEHPFAIRYPKDSCVELSEEPSYRELEIGSWEELEAGEDVVLLAVGTMVGNALKARTLLARQGIKAGVVNARFVKPLDTRLLHRLAERVPLIVTIEENVLRGGFGAHMTHQLQEERLGAGQVLSLGLPDGFVEHGSRGILLDVLGLSAERVAQAVEDRLGLDAGSWSAKAHGKTSTAASLH